MTDDEIELQNAQIKKKMCYELMDLCLTTDPVRLFGPGVFENPEDFKEVFSYIDHVYQNSDIPAFCEFYNVAMEAAKSPDGDALVAEAEGSESDLVRLKTLCEMAYERLTPEQQKLLLEIDFNRFRAEIEARYKDGSLLPDNILGFLLHTINTFSIKH